MAAQFVRSVLSGEVQDGSTDLLPNHDVAARSKKAAPVPRRDLTFTPPLPQPGCLLPGNYFRTRLAQERPQEFG